MFNICAVGYLNTVPLIWGMLHGPQGSQVNLSFAIPSICARNVESGEAELGLVPVAEIARQDLEIVPGVGIACLGAVRSILLFSRVAWNRIRTLAVDVSSRTSVELARIILRERYGIEPTVTAQPPNLEAMLSKAEAALLIGDAALQVNPDALPYSSLDLGHEWHTLTGLPMVFAAWAGKKGLPLETLSQLTLGSYRVGQEHLFEIINSEYEKRGIARELTQRYLSHHIRYELGPREYEGLSTFLALAGLRAPEMVAFSS